MPLSCQAENSISSVEQNVTDICKPLFEKTNICYFDYNFIYDNGNYYCLTTNSSYVRDYIGQDLYPTL